MSRDRVSRKDRDEFQKPEPICQLIEEACHLTFAGRSLRCLLNLFVALATELLPPAAQSLSADLQLLGDLRQGLAARRPLIGLKQLPDDLVVRVSLTLHRADVSGALLAPMISLDVDRMLHGRSLRFTQCDDDWFRRMICSALSSRVSGAISGSKVLSWR
jgi:hypothetical protein